MHNVFQVLVQVGKYIIYILNSSARVQAVTRVRFPDNHTLEVNFHPSETMQSLVDFLKKVVAQPDIPFYLCKVHFKIFHFR